MQSGVRCGMDIRYSTAGARCCIQSSCTSLDGHEAARGFLLTFPIDHGIVHRRASTTAALLLSKLPPGSLLRQNRTVVETKSFLRRFSIKHDRHAFFRKRPDSHFFGLKLFRSVNKSKCWRRRDTEFKHFRVWSPLLSCGVLFKSN